MADCDFKDEQDIQAGEVWLVQGICTMCASRWQALPVVIWMAGYALAPDVLCCSR